MLELAQGERLIERGAVAPFDFFLVDGALAVSAGPADERAVDASDPDAHYPIAHLRPSLFDVSAAQSAQVVRIEAAELKRRQPALRRARFFDVGRLQGGSWRQHPLAERLIAQLDADSVAVPAMPGIALRIRRALQDGDYDMQRIATIISADPAITATLLKAANSALFPGGAPCETLQAALMRMGMDRAQNIVLAVSTKRLFTGTSPAIKQRFAAAWRHAVDIAAMCSVLARHTNGDPDRSLLIGLLHEIGTVSILSLADEAPELLDHAAVLDDVLEVFAPRFSAEILDAWGLGDDFSDAALYQADWYRDDDPWLDTTDLVIVAHLHALVKERQFRQMPRLDEVPAFAKVAGTDAAASVSLKLLDDARAQVEEIKALLR